MNIVAHNLAAMNASRQFNINSKQKAKDSEQLSSGYRINRAGDDAAGLAISEKMRQMVKGLDRAGDNVQEAISFVQTADGALAEAADMAQRINELAIQAANGTQSESDRRAIDNEVQQLKTEMSRIFETTTFNNKKIWDGEGRVGSQVTVTIDEPMMKTMGNKFSLTVTNENKYAVPSSAPEIVADDKGYHVEWKGYLPDGSVNPTPYKTKEVLWEDIEGGIKGLKKIDLANLELTDDSPKGAGCNITNLSFSTSISFNVNATDAEALEQLKKVRLPFNQPTEQAVSLVGPFSMVSCSINYPTQLMLGKDFSKTDVDFIKAAVSDNVVQPTDTTNFELNFTGTKVNADGTIGGAVNFSTSPNSADKYAGSTTYWDPTVTDSGSGEKGRWWYYDTDGYGNELPWKGALPSMYSYTGTSFDVMKQAISGSKNADGSDNNLYPCLNDNTGGKIISYRVTMPIYIKGTDTGVGSISLNLGGSYTDIADVKTAFSNLTSVDINAKANSYSVSRSIDDGQSVETKSVDYHIDKLVFDPHDVSVQSGAETGNTTILQYPDLNINALGIEYLRMHPQEMALLAIDDIGKAIAIINKSRALFGAYQNRLESTYNINAYTMENTQASESAIRDTDMAKAMLAFTKDNIVSQASQSMLTQANMSAEDVLSLLQ